MNSLFGTVFGLGSVFLAIFGCSAPTESVSDVQFASPVATLLSFEFDGEVEVDSVETVRNKIERQLMYTVGQLNGEYALSRLDTVRLTDVSYEKVGPYLYSVRYHAVLSVAWGNKNRIPSQYTFTVPKKLSYKEESGFVSKYNASCVDGWSAPRNPGPGMGNVWYYYRPNERTCQFAESDVVHLQAKVSVSDENMQSSYPELDKIWEDNTLKAVVIFGKDNAGATSVGDFGISQYGLFNYNLKLWGSSELGTKVAPNQEDLPASPGVNHPDVTWTGTYSDGRRVEIVAMLIDNPRATTQEFDTRYNELSRDADIIIYNGHAAYGDNIRKFAAKGTPNPGQYTIFSLMGCDSYAYIDDQMAAQRRAINPDDTTGTKYLDIITNIMPTNPTKLRTAAMALIAGVANPHKPLTYNEILRRFERDHYAVVTGDLDNTYRPR